MALSITYHGDRPRTGPGQPIDALGKQVGDAINVADNYAFLTSGLFRVRATADHTVRFGDSTLNAATNGEVWKADDREVRWMNIGEKVYIS